MIKIIGRFRHSLLLFLVLCSVVSAETLREDPDLLFRQAVRLRAENRYDAALEKFNRVLEENPRHAGALVALTELTYFLGNFEECRRIGKEALAAAPENADLYLYVGAALSYSGSDADAVTVLKKGARLAPERPDFWLELARVEEARQNFAAARRTYQKVLDLAPEHAPAAYGIAIAYQAEGKTAKARRWLEKAVAWDPSLADAHFSLGLLDLEAGKEAAAEARFRKVLEISTVHPGAFLSLASLEEKKGNRLAQYYWLSRAHPYLRERVEKIMGEIEAEFQLPREKMEPFARDEVPVKLGDLQPQVIEQLGAPPYRSPDGALFGYLASGLFVRFENQTVVSIRLEEGFRGKAHGLSVGLPVEEVPQIYGPPDEKEGGIWRYRFQNECVTIELEKGKIKAILLEGSKR